MFCTIPFIRPGALDKILDRHGESCTLALMCLSCGNAAICYITWLWNKYMYSRTCHNTTIFYEARPINLNVLKAINEN